MMTDTARAAIPQSPTTMRWGIASTTAEEHRDARALEVVGDDDRIGRRSWAAPTAPGESHRPLAQCGGSRRSAAAESFIYDRAMPEPSVTPDDVRRAAGVIRDAVHRTPTFTSRSLGPGRYLKAELFQRTGSFKARGALNRIRALSAAEREAGVISVSAGNHAQALAWAAAAEGIDALLVMWQGASAAKVEATRGYGATDRSRG